VEVPEGVDQSKVQGPGQQEARNKAKRGSTSGRSSADTELNSPSPDPAPMLYAPAAAPPTSEDALGGLSGSYGSGGLGSSGRGVGGGGMAEGLSGIGTQGYGSGVPRSAVEEGSYGKKDAGNPGVSSGSPIILGSLDKSVIDRVVKQHLAEIRYCYQKELNKDPSLAGKIVLQFTIQADGRVSAASIKSTSLNNKVVESCITGRFLRFKFPQPVGGGKVMVSYPFVFKAQ